MPGLAVLLMMGRAHEISQSSHDCHDLGPAHDRIFLAEFQKIPAMRVILSVFFYLIYFYFLFLK